MERFFESPRGATSLIADGRTPHHGTGTLGGRNIRAFSRVALDWNRLGWVRTRTGRTGLRVRLLIVAAAGAHERPWWVRALPFSLPDTVWNVDPRTPRQIAVVSPKTPQHWGTLGISTHNGCRLPRHLRVKSQLGGKQARIGNDAHSSGAFLLHCFSVRRQTSAPTVLLESASRESMPFMEPHCSPPSYS